MSKRMNVRLLGVLCLLVFGLGFVVIPGISNFFFPSDAVVVSNEIKDDYVNEDENAEVIQVDYEAPRQYVATYYLDPSDGDRLLDGLFAHLRRTSDHPNGGPLFSLPWMAVDEIVWSLRADGAFLDQNGIEEALEYADWFDLDVSKRFVEDPDDSSVNVVFQFGDFSEYCGDRYAPACVNRIGGIYDAAGPCVISMSDQANFDKDTLRYDASDEDERKIVVVAEVIVHEMGHCMGLTHRTDGIMTMIMWEPDVLLVPSVLERRIAQGILDELRERAAETQEQSGNPFPT